MEMAILSLHVLVCLCLVGLVLLQRSEGGALGMGGGGGGSLMSGRGAADALARMTSIAGGFFLATSLSLTVISGAAASNRGPSPLDLAPSREAPATLPSPLQTRPDPTESTAPQADDTQLADLSAAPGGAQPVQVAPPPTQASERAGPLTPASQPAPRRAPAQTTTPPRQQPAQTQPAAARQQPAQNQPAAARPRPVAAQPSQRLVIPNTSGSGTEPETTAPPPESVQTEPGLQPVRRERAGPDQ